MNIPDIGVAGISIPDVGIYLPPIRRAVSTSFRPVSMLPVVQIPGCVEAHVDSDLQTELTTKRSSSNQDLLRCRNAIIRSNVLSASRISAR